MLYWTLLDMYYTCAHWGAVQKIMHPLNCVEGEGRKGKDPMIEVVRTASTVFLFSVSW